MWHFYAEIYYNNRKDDGLYANGSGVVTTSSEPHEYGWYDELRREILKELRVSKASPDSVMVMSLTKL